MFAFKNLYKTMKGIGAEGEATSTWETAILTCHSIWICWSLFCNNHHFTVDFSSANVAVHTGAGGTWGFVLLIPLANPFKKII